MVVSACYQRAAAAKAAQPDLVGQLQLGKVGVGQQRREPFASWGPGSLRVCGRDGVDWRKPTIRWCLTDRRQGQAGLITATFNRIPAATLQSGQTGRDEGERE